MVPGLGLSIAAPSVLQTMAGSAFPFDKKPQGKGIELAQVFAWCEDRQNDGHRLVRRSLLVGPARSLALLMYLGGAGRAGG